MAKRKVIVEKMETVYDGPTADTARNEWNEESTITGGEKVVAGFLQALADEIDPPRRQVPQLTHCDHERPMTNVDRI